VAARAAARVVGARAAARAAAARAVLRAAAARAATRAAAARAAAASSQSISIYHWKIGAKISVSISICRFLRPGHVL